MKEILLWISSFFTLVISIFWIQVLFTKNEKSKETGKFPKVSILIPAYNEEKNISKTIESVLKLNYPKNKIEIIVVDNESSDSTIKLAKKYGAKTHILFGKPPLVCQQRNLGAKRATGEYLLFLDHDMEISKGLLN